MHQAQREKHAAYGRTLLVPITASQVFSGISLLLSPLFLPVLMARFHIRASQAGLLIGAELMSFALVTILGARIIPLNRRRRFALLGPWISLVGHVLSFFAPTPLTFALCRTLAGTGGGLVSCTCTAAISDLIEKERILAISGFTNIVNGAFWILLFPLLQSQLGFAGTLLPSVVLSLVAIVSVRGLPEPSTLAETATAASSTLSKLRFALPIALMATQIAHGVYYTYLQVRGTAVGMSDQATAISLSVGTIVVLLGILLAGWLRERAGILKPVMAGVILNGVSMILALLLSNVHLYLASIMLQAATIGFSLIYQTSIAALSDGSGQIVAIGAGMVTLAHGIAPALGGAVIERAGYSGLAGTILALNIVAVGLYGLYWARVGPCPRPAVVEVTS